MQVGRARGAVLVAAQGLKGGGGFLRAARLFEQHALPVSGLFGALGRVQIVAQGGESGLRLGVAAGGFLVQGDLIGTGADALARVFIVGDGFQNGDGLAVRARLLKLDAPRIGAAVGSQQIYGNGDDDDGDHRRDQRDLAPAQFAGGAVFRHIFSSFTENSWIYYSLF